MTNETMGTMNAVDSLSREHEHLRILLERLQAAAEARDASALVEALNEARHALGEELDAHIAVEESSVFAAAEAALGAGFVMPFREEHRQIEALRGAVLAWNGAADPPYGDCIELCERILEHQQREDVMLFPAVEVHHQPDR
jgi:hypothetical protein